MQQHLGFSMPLLMGSFRVKSIPGPPHPAFLRTAAASVQGCRRQVFSLNVTLNLAIGPREPAEGAFFLEIG